MAGLAGIPAVDARVGFSWPGSLAKKIDQDLSLPQVLLFKFFIGVNADNYSCCPSSLGEN